MKKLALTLTLSLAALSAHAMEKEVKPALSTGELVTLLTAMPEGDAASGAGLHQEYWCASCHGPSGVSQSRNYPSVAGQVETYVYKTLLDYRDGRRSEGSGRTDAMIASVLGMSDQQLADLAAYYASETGPQFPASDTSDATLELVRKGDPDRLITPCASCHGVDGKSGIRPETPALAGREPSYLSHTLRMYRSDKRANDTANGMGFFAQRLSDSEIEALAAYYAGLGAQ